MLATCLNGSLLDQLSCTIVYLHNLFTCTFGRINMSLSLSVPMEHNSQYFIFLLYFRINSTVIS